MTFDSKAYQREWYKQHRFEINLKRRKQKYCKYCCRSINISGWTKHLRTDKHKINFFEE